MRNLGSPGLAVHAVTPVRGPAGTAVTISGGCFSPTASDNGVRFDGVAATVSSATPYRLVVTVPAGLPAGDASVSVTVSGSTASAPRPFVVTPGSAAAPVITGVAPSPTAPGAAVTISGSGFDPEPANNVVRINATMARVTAASADELTVQVPAYAVGSGRVSVRTPNGSATSTEDLFVAPESFQASQVTDRGRVQLGVDETVPVPPTGEVAVRLFDVPAGQRVILVLNDGDRDGCNMFAYVRDPLGTKVVEMNCFGDGSYVGDFVGRTGGGSYQFVVVRQYASAPASVVLSVRPVPADVTGSVTIGGGPRSITLHEQGQNGRFTFTGTAGQQFDVRFPDTTVEADVEIRNPDGTVLRPRAWAWRDAYFAPITLPMAGAYAIEVDPRGRSIGTFTVQLGDVPVSLLTSLTIGGEIGWVRNAVSGQKAYFAFDATAGQRISIGYAGDITVLSGLQRPDGSWQWGPGAITYPFGFTDAFTLPQTGTYLYQVEFWGGAVGAFYARLHDVPADAVATTAIGSRGKVSVRTPGQNASILFEGTEGQRISATYRGTMMSGVQPVTRYRAPDGAVLRERIATDPGGWDTLTLPQTGTYVLDVDPSGGSIGDFQVRLIDVPPDATSEVTIGGPPGTVTTTVGGQNANMYFDGTEGQRVSATFAGSTMQPYVSIYKPDGTVLRGADQPPDYWFYDPFTLPVTGRYRIFIDPFGMQTGMESIRLYDVPGDAAAAATVDGPPVTVANTVPGQNMAVTFDATAGQVVTIAAANIFAWSTFTLRRPDGSTLSTQDSGFNNTLTFANLTLPDAGTYTLHVDVSWLHVGGLTVAVTTPGGGSAAPLVSRVPSRPLAAERFDAAGAARPVAPPPAGENRSRPGQTALAGRVLQASGRPLPGVTVSADEYSVRTDTGGRFRLTGLTPGHHELLVDGHAATRAGRDFGAYEIGVDVTAGRTTTLAYPIYLTPIDTANAIAIPAVITKETVLTTPLVPGLEIRLPAGARVTDHYGRPVTSLTITPIRMDRPPFPLPHGVRTPVYFTVQPGGAYVQGGAQITYPNSTGLPSGTVVEFWHYDPDGRGWYVYGRGKVTPDGKQIRPDADTRVYEFTGAMINVWGLIAALLGVLDQPIFGGDPVDLGTGLFVERHTDLAVDDIMPIDLTRTYRQLDDQVRPFGRGANHTFGIFLHSERQYQEVDLVLPDSGKVHFVRVSPGNDTQTALFRAVGTTGPFRNATVHNRSATWILTRADGMVYTFPEEKPLRSIRDRHGNEILITRQFGDWGNIVQVTSPGGRWLRFVYDGNLVTEVSDNTGRTVHYGYDFYWNRLMSVTGPTGAVTRYTYDAQHAITTITDPRNITYLTNAYDAAGRIQTQTLADASTYQYGYATDTNGKVTEATVTDPEGVVRRITFDAAGRATAETVADGTALARNTTVERDPDTGDIVGITDPYGRTTTFGGDNRGNTTTVTELAGTPQARTHVLTWDAPFDRLVMATDPLGHTSRYGYDAAANPVSVTDGEGRIWRAGYDVAGRLVSTTDPLGHTTTWQYENGDLVSVTDALGRSARVFIDATGRATAATDPAGATTLTRYNADDTIASVVDPLGNTTQFAHDGNRNLTRVVDARGNECQYGYDARDRLAEVTDPLGAVTRYGYDRVDRPTSMVDRRGITTTWSYDALGRVAQARYGSESTVDYGYDALDRLAGLEGMAWQYDVYDRLVSEAGPAGTVGYAYDAADRVTSMTVSGQQPISYSYDQADLLTSMTQGGTTVGWTRDSAARVTRIDRPGTATGYEYDEADQLVGLTYVADGGSPIGDLRYGLDATGRIAELSGSLARVTVPAGTGPATYDAADRLTARGGQAFAYDADGNLVSDGARSYTWNARGELSTVSSASADVSFGYDALGRRTRVTVDGTERRYLYDGPNVVREEVGGTAADRLTAGLDQTLLRAGGDGTRAPLTDHVGTVLGLTDPGGAVARRYQYDPYGAVTATGDPSDNTQQYTGREYDAATGLLYNRARYYSPDLGRFISEDPIDLAGGSTNLYQYANGDPVDMSDPTGHFAIGPFALGCGLGVGFGLLSHGRKYTWGDALRDCLIGGVLSWGLARGIGRLLPKWKPPGRYARPARATDTDPAEAIRQAGRGKPCPQCGNPMQPGGPNAPTAPHDPPLAEKWYTGNNGQNWHPDEFAEYARSAESLDPNAWCRLCQQIEGGHERQLVRALEDFIRARGWR